MSEHVFGGDWTEVKLAKLGEYLNAYRRIFSRNSKASYFKTWYVDAFAGTGTRTKAVAPRPPGKPLFGNDVYKDADTKRYRAGSAKIAIALSDPFHKYLFIDKSARRINELKQVIQKEYGKLISRCDFQHGDANDVLKQWCKERNWSKERAVVFLDPYGMQVEWSTIKTLGGTEGVDLWYLFPLGVGVARLLKRDGDIDESWAKRLDIFFGTRDWRKHFYITRERQGLFETLTETKRDASVKNIQAFINEQLKTCFAGVAEGLVLRNSKSSPMYSLCFAAANARGAPVAIKIAQDILAD